jgi:hypothetical protein
MVDQKCCFGYTSITVNKTELVMRKLNVKSIETKSAGAYAYAAAMNATLYSDQCRMLYTNSQRAKAETFLDIVCAAYSARKAYITYRKSFMTIKVDAPTLRDRHARNVLDTICTERGYQKVVSAQGIIYRMLGVA